MGRAEYDRDRLESYTRELREAEADRDVRRLVQAHSPEESLEPARIARFVVGGYEPGDDDVLAVTFRYNEQTRKELIHLALGVENARDLDTRVTVFLHGKLVPGRWRTLRRALVEALQGVMLGAIFIVAGLLSLLH